MDDYKKIEQQIVGTLKEKGSDAFTILENAIGVTTSLEHQKIINSVLSRIHKKDDDSFYMIPYEKDEISFKPSLDKDLMERLRKGFGSLDEHEYYEQTEEFYNDMLLESIYDNLYRLVRGKVKVSPSANNNNEIF